MVPMLLMRNGRPKTVNTSSATNANAHIMSLYSTAFSSHKNSVGFITHGRNYSQTEIRAQYDLGSVKNGSHIGKIIKGAPVVNELAQKQQCKINMINEKKESMFQQQLSSFQDQIHKRRSRLQRIMGGNIIKSNDRKHKAQVLQDK